jgi:CheY-like chemotaxis protein
MNDDLRPIVLVVDDRQDTLTPVIDMLRHDFRVVAATTIEKGKKELRLAAQLYQSEPRRRFAVVITDLRFDNLDGGAAIEEEKRAAGMEIVQEARLDGFCEVIMITAYAPLEADRALEKGVFRYIAKHPVAQSDHTWLEEVRSAVESAVAVRERWMNLFGDLQHIHNLVGRLDQSGKAPQNMVFGLEQSVNTALMNFDTLLRGKGHKTL